MTDREFRRALKALMKQLDLETLPTPRLLKVTAAFRIHAERLAEEIKKRIELLEREN